MPSLQTTKYQRTKAPRRFNVLTKALDVEKRQSTPKYKSVWFPLNPVSAIVVLHHDLVPNNDLDIMSEALPLISTLVMVASESRKGRAMRRFNVLTKPSVARARMGIPANIKTIRPPQHHENNLAFLLPEHSSALMIGKQSMKPALQTTTRKNSPIAIL